MTDPESGPESDDSTLLTLEVELLVDGLRQGLMNATSLIASA